MGPGGHRPANSGSGSGGESAPHPPRQPQTYLQGTAGLLDSGHGPEGGRPGGWSPSQGPQVSLVGQGRERRRGAAAGQRGPSRGSRGPGSPLSTSPPPPPPFCLPLGVAAAALRRRFPGCRHFPASLARGPRTGGFCPPGRQQPARSLWPPALRWSPSSQRVGERRPASPPPGAARLTRPGSWIRLSPSQVRSFQYLSLFLNCALSVHE